MQESSASESIPTSATHQTREENKPRRSPPPLVSMDGTRRDSLVGLQRLVYSSQIFTHSRTSHEDPRPVANIGENVVEVKPGPRSAHSQTRPSLHVAYVDGEGNVKISPMIYGRQEDFLYLHGHVSAGVLRNGSIDLCFCMTLEDGLVLARSGMHSSVNYRCVMVHGKAEEVADPTAKWSSLDLIVDHAAGPSPGFSQTVQRPMTEAEVASTRVLRLEMKDGCVSAKTRAEGANDDKEDIENPKLWAGIVPITRVYGPAVNDPSLRFHVLPPEAVRNYPKHRSGLPHCVEKRSGDHRPYIALALTFGAGLLVGAWMSKR